MIHVLKYWTGKEWLCFDEYGADHLLKAQSTGAKLAQLFSAVEIHSVPANGKSIIIERIPYFTERN